MRQRRGPLAEAHQPGDEMRESARAGAGFRIELDGRIDRAGAIGEAARVQPVFQKRAPRLEILARERTGWRLRRHRADDREQPLAAPDGQLRLAALV